MPVIVATAYGDSERTIRAMRDGAFDYLTKPFDLGRAARHAGAGGRTCARWRSQAAPAPDPPEVRQDLVGTSAAMLAVWKLIGRAAGIDGAGAGDGRDRHRQGAGGARHPHLLAARAGAVRRASTWRRCRPTLIESELFGHERGAFTGATARRGGRFEAAAGGTLFLDEIGDLDPSLQAKLLRVVQEGTYERVGGDTPLVTDARIIAATNRPVRPGAPGAALREELYYRLAVIEIELPPLRARPSDIPLLVAHALRGRTARAVSEAAMQRLLANPWPGNVRELYPRARARGRPVRRRGDRRRGSPGGRRATAPARRERPRTTRTSR